jgi:ribose/xylose/arabinose/galactoside ABC-type transport system permease subunit
MRKKIMRAWLIVTGVLAAALAFDLMASFLVMSGANPWWAAFMSFFVVVHLYHSREWIQETYKENE